MGIFNKWFGQKMTPKEKVGGMEDYMTLVKVYFQAALAAKLGITNLNMLPDLRVFKQTLHVATVHNKLGVGEKSAVKKMMKNLYKTDEDFFDEIDQSLLLRMTLYLKYLKMMKSPMNKMKSYYVLVNECVETMS